MIDWPRPEFMENMNIEGNVGLLATRQTTTDFCHVTCSRKMIEMKACSHDRNTEFFPMFIRESGKLFAPSKNAIVRPNFSDSFMRWARSWSTAQSGDVEDAQVAKNALYYIVALVYSPTYRKRYADLLRRS